MQPIAPDRVMWSVYWSVTIVNPGQMAEPIEMSFELLTRVAQGTMH